MNHLVRDEERLTAQWEGDLYSIEYFCGRKYGGWLMSEMRFGSADLAREQIRMQEKAEARADGASFLRRVVPVG